MLEVFVRPILGGALGLGGLVLAFAPTSASAAGPSKAISISGVAYTCKADNAVINQSVGGPQTFLINARAQVPASIASGDTVPSIPATLDLVMPSPLMDRIRKMPTIPAGGVSTIAGSATADVVLEGVAPGGTKVGALSRAVKNLAASAQSVPASGAMTIADVQGTVDSFTAPTFPSATGLAYVELPLYFKLHAVLDPAVLGSISTTDLDCYRQQDSAAQRVIGTIDVGAGCATSDCVLPAAVDRTCVPAWADPAQSGSGCTIGSGGSTPTPGGGSGNGGSTGGTGGSGGSAGGSSGSTGGSGGSTGTTANDGGSGSAGGSRAPGVVNASDTDDVTVTTELPDTGSAVGPWLYAVFGLALLARLGLLVRQRVARAGSVRRAR